MHVFQNPSLNKDSTARFAVRLRNEMQHDTSTLLNRQDNVTFPNDARHPRTENLPRDFLLL